MKNNREQSSFKSLEEGRHQVLNAFIKIEKKLNCSGIVVDGVQRPSSGTVCIEGTWVTRKWLGWREEERCQMLLSRILESTCIR